MNVCPKCGSSRVVRTRKEPRNRSGIQNFWVCRSCETKRVKTVKISTPLGGFKNRIGAIRRRGKFNITIDARYLFDLWEQQAGRCVLSGVKMTWRTGDVRLTSISIDRINQRKGYVPRNVRLICWGLNNLRSHRSDAEALKLARAYVRYQS